LLSRESAEICEEKVSADPRDDLTIGLCLSGGGFRASFYALGIFRYLAEADRLKQVTAISAVSGGAIAAAAVADKWATFQAAGGDDAAFLANIDKPFRDFVTRKNLRRRWAFASLASVVPFTGGRGGALARTLDHNLYERKRVRDLPADPDFIFTSTDLASGRAFWVAPSYIGSFDYGYIEPTPTSVDLKTVVAASAAFPPSLTVVKLPTKRLPFPKVRPPKKLSLVDGGVYDNLGLEWFQGWGEDALRPEAAVQPSFVIVANASGMLEYKDKDFSARAAIMRELAIQYRQVLALRTRWLRATLDHQPGVGIYMAVKDKLQHESALPGELVEPLALLRTDLDRFDKTEADLLSYHAYWTLHVRLAANRPELAVSNPSWTEYAGREPENVEQLRTTLELGRHRFFRRTRALVRRLPLG
jgi:predicted acylesterase/phospholipase RssA